MSKIIDLGQFANTKRPENPTQNNSTPITDDYPPYVEARPNLNYKITKKKSKWKLILILLFIIIAIIAFIIFGFFGFNIQKISSTISTYNSSDCKGDICNEVVPVVVDKPVCNGILCNNSKQNLPQSDGRTNILITGIDTHDTGSKTYLTDTIIVMSYDHKTGNAYMISIPRDLTVTYKNYYGNLNTTKINEVYYYGGRIEDQHVAGMLTLQKIVTDITGQPIHYNVQITLTGFMQLIDKLGGVTIPVAEDTTDVYPYIELPDAFAKSFCGRKVYIGDGYYCEWTIKAGNVSMDGQTALVYARSRKYGTDWDRALRQQQVINALRTKITNSSTLANPQYLFDIITTLKDNIKVSNFTINDILAALDLKSDYKKSVSIVVDPAFGGGGIVANGPADTGLGSHQVFTDKTYANVKQYLSYIYTNPDSYVEKPNIFVYSDVGESSLKTDYYKILSDDANYPGTTASIVVVPNSTTTFNLGNYLATSSSSSASTNSAASSKSTTVSTAVSSSTTQKVYIVDYTNGQKPNMLKNIMDKYPEITLLKVDKSFKKFNDEDFAIIVEGK